MIEDYLKQFTHRQRLEAYIQMLKESGVESISVEMLRSGFGLAQPDGWQMVAPAWMKPYETEGIRPLEEFIDDEPAYQNLQQLAEDVGSIVEDIEPVDEQLAERINKLAEILETVLDTMKKGESVL